ncbi:ribonuclease P protein subunit p38 [Protopterus annectens]|uniref:ribonuclease P protein subunit p38 n=1 Tax=Protopterus annectens TaxID=7888 RepID=UPI001CFB4258|nr:ribonuclease P protein subunit p38 [Protopterus annectens]XP_043941839.1 ribonuclease P protein subunit p38 [Protopterus annectens]
MASASQTGKGAVRKAKQVPVKNSLDNPYHIEWNTLERGDMHFILQILKDTITEVGLKKLERPKKKRTFTKKRKSRSKSDQQQDDALRKPAGEEAEVNEDQQDDDCPSTVVSKETKGSEAHLGWSDLEIRKRLAIGINEVTRALEKDQLCLVLVCKSVKPALMTRHLIQLSASRAVPACQVPRLSENVAPLIGLKSVLALGFHRDAGTFADAVNVIIPKVPSLQVPWIQHTQAEEEAVDESLDLLGDKDALEANGTPSQETVVTVSQKRKHTEDVLDTNKQDVLQLQPLKVKKLVPNPNRVRKPKKKKQKK